MYSFLVEKKYHGQHRGQPFLQQTQQIFCLSVSHLVLALLSGWVAGVSARIIIYCLRRSGTGRWRGGRLGGVWAAAS